MNAYVKVSADDAKGTHGDEWVELEYGDFMHRISNDEIAELLVVGAIWNLYMEANMSETGTLISKPFEPINLFGENAEPYRMRFAKARLALVADE